MIVVLGPLVHGRRCGYYEVGSTVPIQWRRCTLSVLFINITAYDIMA